MDEYNPYSQFILDNYSNKLAEGPAMPGGGEGLLGISPENTGELLRREQEARLPELFAHFDISPESPTAWEYLARALANKHVPGFAWKPIAPVPTLESGLGLWPLPWTGTANGAHLPFRRGRGRPRKILYGGGLLGLPEPIKDKKPAHRPTTYIPAIKSRFVSRFDQLHSQACLATGSKISHETFAKDFDLPNKLLKLYYRFKGELLRSEKSKKSEGSKESLQILASFGSNS